MCDPLIMTYVFVGGIAFGVIGVMVVGWFLLKNTKFS